MSRPYQNPFDSGQAPPNRLQPGNISQSTSPTAAGVQPTSFKTNVNRAKTKRWVEAKSYSYDGDDWGDADDYDEYGGYDEPPQPAKPTGLRQPGQAVNPQSFSNHGGGASSEGRQQVYQRRDYGDLSAQSPGQRQQDGSRSATNPVPSSTFGRDRANSFDRGDEKRSFSAGELQINSAADHIVQMESNQGGSYPPTRFSQMGVVGSPTGISAPSSQHQQPVRQGGHLAPSLQVQTQLPTYSDRPAFDQAMPPWTNYQAPMYFEQPREIGTGSRTQSMTSNTPSLDLQNRRDFSPSALPPPLHTRPSPAPQSANEDLSATRFPPRKSSLSQRSSPYVPSPATSFHGPQSLHDSTSAVAAQAEALPSSRDRAGSNATKPPQFVRPADIYKRMEEEREKERQSQESGRPSLDSIMGRSSEDEFGSAAGLPRERSLSETPGRLRRKSSMGSTDDGDGGRKLKSILDPVQERKSEYVFEGFSADDQGSARKAPYAPSRRSADVVRADIGRADIGRDQIPEPAAHPRSLNSPILPSVHRVSGFGDDFMKEPTRLRDDALVDKDVPMSAIAPAIKADHLSPNGEGEVEQPLQRQPSLGFRSVVNQAFDRPEDRSVPPTPSSMGGSGVARTNSESTTGVSPIMSRVPSAATAEAKPRAAETREAAVPAIAEEVNETGSRPTSPGGVGTPRQGTRKLPPSQSVSRNSTESLPQPFKPGHRRDLSTPSPGNSPARSPAVEAIQVLPHAEQVEMASATPVENKSTGAVDWPQAAVMKGNSRNDYATREADTASSVNASPEKGNVADIVNEAQSSFLDSRRNNALGSSRQSRPESPIARNESPTKGKVRDLADRFETGGSSRRGSTVSIPSKVGLSGATVQNDEDLTPPRPLTDRLGSFRPKLPGGWESYATTSGMASPGKELKGRTEDRSKPIEQVVDVEKPFAAVTTPTLAEKSVRSSEDEDFDITPTTVKRTLSTSQSDSTKDLDSSRDPFTAAAAAGSALAGALAAAVGLDYHKTQSETSSSSSEETHQTSNRDEYGAARGRSRSIETASLHPEASKPVIQAEGTDSVSTASSASPTLPSKDTLLTEHEPVQSTDHLPLTVPLKQRTGEPARAHDPPSRPPMLPSLSTEYGPQDYESDRLRKEIFRSLSPRTSEHDDGSRLDLTRQETDERNLSGERSLMGQGRESTVLPKEYESYWNGSSDEEEPYEQSSYVQGKPQYVFEPEGKPDHPRSPVINEQNPKSIRVQSPEMDPSSDLHRPALLPHRFSWEQNSAEGPSPEPTPLQPAEHQAILAKSNDPFDQAGHELAQSAIGHGPSGSVNEQDGATEPPPVPLADSGATGISEHQENTKDSHEFTDSDSSAFRDGEIALISGVAGTALGTSAMSGRRSDGNLNHDFLPKYEGGLEVLRPSTEKESASGSGHQPYMMSENEPYASESLKDRHGQPEAQYTLDPNSMEPAEVFRAPPSSAAAAQPKILAFREILALKSPGERIRAYNDTREQFANIDTGVGHWITTTISELPEHVDLLSTAGRFNVGTMGHRPSPSRGKLLKLSPTNAQTTQQPYYQQYLNASSQPAAAGSSVALPGTSGNDSQGFSPSPGGAGKMTSQQVQAKGKDLLHSAGVLGGKANIAAKGLFSKGKSRFRSSGGVDKVDN